MLEIKLSEILVDESRNSRHKFTNSEVAELAKSIAAHGLLYPVDVNTDAQPPFKYRLVAGFRRFAAHRVLGLETIKARLRTEDADVLNATENIQRKDLNPIEEATFIQRAYCDMPVEEIAAILGKSKGWVTDRLTLLELPDEDQERVACGMLSITQAKRLVTSYRHNLTLEQFKAREELMRRFKGQPPKIVNKKLPRPTKAEIKRLITLLFTLNAPNLVTRCLAWSMGAIDYDDITKDIDKLRK